MPQARRSAALLAHQTRCDENTSVMKPTSLAFLALRLVSQIHAEASALARRCSRRELLTQTCVWPRDFLTMFKLITFLAIIVTCASALAAVPAGAYNRPQVQIIPQEVIPPSPALSAEDELKSFHLAPGIRVELVACEPMVERPVAVQCDPDGCLWVVEMRAFMPHLEGEGEDNPIGRVSVLEDTDGDGRMDKSAIFLDGLVMPRARRMTRASSSPRPTNAFTP